MNQFRAEEYLADTRVEPAQMQRGSTVESISACPRLIAPLLAVVLCSPLLAQSGRPDPTPPPAAEPITPPEETSEAILEEASAEDPSSTEAEENASELENEAVEELILEEVEEELTADAEEKTPTIVWSIDGLRSDRRPVKDEPVVLAFKDVK